MPNETASNLPEWNEENLSAILSKLFEQAETDPVLLQQLLSNPFELLKSRIAIPDEYRGGIFARENGKKSLLIHVPTSGVAPRALPEGTLDATSPPPFEALCTIPLW